MSKIFIISLLILAAAAPVSNQTKATDLRYRLAESYEQSGDFEAAVKIYETLFAGDSTNMAVFEALRRDYMQLKRYDNAIALLQFDLHRNPNNIIMLSQLASVYILKSEESKADSIWERAISIDPKHETTYRFVGSAMGQSRQFERAANLYKRGRVACGDPTLFTSDIAYLYSIMLKYPEATTEYLNLVRQNPGQLGYAEARIAAYTGRSDGLSAATVSVEQAVKSEPDNIIFEQMLAWLYMEGKHYDQAFEVYKVIDQKSHAEGRELFGFASRALNEKAYAVAANAFAGIAAKYPKFDQMGQVKFGFARTQEEIGTERDTLKLFGGLSPFASKPHDENEGKQLFGPAITAYRQVISEFPANELAARSMLRIAILQQEKLFDLQGARSELETLCSKYPMFPVTVAEATLRLGDVYLMTGDLAKAEAEYRILAPHNTALDPRQETATMRLARLDYYQTRFQDALAKLKDLTRNPGSDVTNDALTLQIFVQDNLRGDGAPLKAFAAADLLSQQQKFPEALAAFQSVVQKYPKSDVVDEALMNVGDLMTRLGRFNEALAVYDTLRQNYPESIELDKTAMKIAEVYRLGLKDVPNAIATYQKVLEQYPNSIYAAEARRRIRELRGDNI